MSWKALLLLCALFLAFKVPFLFLSPYVYDEEEVKPGAIGYTLTHGAPLPVLEYVVGGHEGGTLVMGVASIPFQILLGPTLFSYKVLSILVSLGILVLAAALLNRIAGRAAALAAAALLIISPPYLTQFNFIVWGNYVVTTLLTLLALTLFVRLAFEKTGTRLLAPVLGAVCGLALFIHFGFLVTILVVLLFWYLTDHRFLTRASLWTFAAGFLVGFSPWIAYNATHRFWGLDRVSDGVAARVPVVERLSRALENLQSLFARDLASAWHFKGMLGIDLRIWSYLFYGLLLIGLVGLLFMQRKSIAAAFRALIPGASRRLEPTTENAVLLFPAYFFAYAAVYALSDYGLLRAEWGNLDPETHAHVFVILYFLLYIAALFAGRLAKNRILYAGFLAPILLLSLAGNAFLIAPEQSKAERLGISFAAFESSIYEEIGQRYAFDDPGRTAVSGRLERYNLWAFWYGVGTGLGARYWETPQTAIERCEAPDADLERICRFGVGNGIVQRADAGLEPRTHAVRSVADGPSKTFVIGGAAVSLRMQGFGEDPLVNQAQEMFRDPDLDEQYPAEYLHFFRSKLYDDAGLSEKK